jgi:general stress protein CsbA
MILLSSGCVTQDHRLTIEAPDTEKPVSASGSYITEEGSHVPPEGYEIIDHFKITRRVSAPVVGKSENSLDLQPVINELLQEDGAEAVVNLQIFAEDYDEGNVRAVGALNVSGWFLTGMGVPLVIAGLADGYEENYYMVDMFAVMSLIGGGCLTASYILPNYSESAWIVGLEGDTVRRAP